jgi:hypothetical protein
MAADCSSGGGAEGCSVDIKRPARHCNVGEFLPGAVSAAGREAFPQARIRQQPAGGGG